MPPLSDRSINEMMISQTTPFSMGNSFGTSFSTQMTQFTDQVVASPNKDLLGLVSYSTRTRAEYLKNLGDVIDVDAAKAIIDIYSEKTLYASKDDEICKIRFNPKNGDELERGYVEEINNAIQDFIEDVNLFKFLKRMLDKLLLYGEFPYRKEFAYKQGITKLIDDISVSELVGIYENGEVKKFYMVRANSAQEVSKESYGHFIISPVTIREISDSMLCSFNEGSAVMGKSILYNAIEQLKNLRTNQIVSLIDDIKRILRPQFYGVSVPETANPAEVTKLLRKYERDFRSPADALGRDSANLTVNDIVYLAAQIRFIPQFANGKGTITEIDAFKNRNDYEENLAKRNAYLQQIAVLVALPPAYLAPGVQGVGTPGSKVEDMKIYSRFAKKLVSIQDAVEEGLIDILQQHIYYKTGYKVRRSSIDITFNSSVDSELLDAIEFTVGNVDIGDRFLAWINNVAQAGLGIQPKPEVILSIFNRLAKAIASEDVFELVKEKTKSYGSQISSAPVGSIESPIPPPPSISAEPSPNAGTLGAALGQLDQLGTTSTPIQGSQDETTII